jgi:hypothetical protein
MNSSHLRIISRLGIDVCLAAAHYARRGEGCSTVACYLGLHWRTASAAMNAGLALPSTPERL